MPIIPLVYYHTGVLCAESVVDDVGVSSQGAYADTLTAVVDQLLIFRRWEGGGGSAVKKIDLVYNV